MREGIKMVKDELVVSLDIGTSKVCTIVGELDENDQIEIVGIGKNPSSGIKKGVIIDLDKAIQSIKLSLESAERMSGLRINSVFISIAGNHISSLNSKGVIAISNDSPEITENDIQKVIEAAKAGVISSERELIHALSQEFIVDGQSGIIDPLGMSGARLECKVHIITDSITAVQNLIKAIEGSSLNIDEIVFGTLAASNAVLSNAEKELGAVLVDIGAGTTEIALFIEGGLVYSAVLPLGGNQITNDLAIGLRTSIEEAENIKINYGSAIEVKGKPKRNIEITSSENKAKQKVPQDYLVEIIEPRVSEILTLVQNELIKSGYSKMIPGGAVITGGSSLLPGITEVAKQVLNLPVRIGFPHYKGELADMVNDPAYSTAIGLLNFANDKNSSDSIYKFSKKKAKVGNIFGKAIAWLKDFF